MPVRTGFVCTKQKPIQTRVSFSPRTRSCRTIQGWSCGFQCHQGLGLHLTFSPTRLSLWLCASCSLDGCFSFSNPSEFQAEKRGKDEGQKQMAVESTPFTSFSTAPCRDFCLQVTKQRDSGNIRVFNRPQCF